MFFLVLAPDAPGMLERRLTLRQDHVDYWQGMGDTVKVAGAMLGGDGADAPAVGSSFLLEAADEPAVRALMAADPFTTGGVFGPDLQIQPVRPAIGAWRPA
ncbi:MAG: YciI family protein [Novosphingobium sp.]